MIYRIFGVGSEVRKLCYTTNGGIWDRIAS